jgi:hypothetical protein
MPAATQGATAETLHVNIAAKLEADGCRVVADQADGDFRAGVLELLRGDSLVIMDDFEALLARDTHRPGTRTRSGPAAWRPAAVPILRAGRTCRGAGSSRCGRIANPGQFSHRLGGGHHATGAM